MILQDKELNIYKMKKVMEQWRLFLDIICIKLQVKYIVTPLLCEISARMARCC